MRNFKYLMVIMVIFALVLSACSSDAGQTGNEAAYPAVTDTTGLETGTANDNLNGNLNDNGNLNGNDNALGGDATSTPLSMATPLGTAMGTPAATEEVAVTTEAVGPLSTETPAGGALTTPMGTETATSGDMMTYENGILLSNLIGASIENANGDGWGTVDSVIFDRATCTVPYVLVQVNADDMVGDGVTTPATNDNGNAAGTPAATAGAAGGANANDNGAGVTTTGTPGATDGLTVTEAPGMGGVAGEGDLVLVPLSAFFAEGQQGVLNLPLMISDEVAQIVTTAPRYTEDTLPDWATPGWDADLSGMWSAYPTLTGGTDGANANANDNGSAAGEVMTGAGAVRLTDVTDLNVTNANGEDLGDIEDVVVMLNNQPAYVFLAVGGILDLGERLIPIPCDLVSWQMDENGALTVMINADQAMLEGAPTLDEIPATFEAGWDTDYSGYWAGTTPGTSPATTPAMTPATMPTATP